MIINNTNLIMYRGNTDGFCVKIDDTWNISDVNELLFCCKKRISDTDDNAIFKLHPIKIENNIAIFEFNHNDTFDKEPRDYFYDIRLVKDNGYVNTLIENSRFTIKNDVLNIGHLDGTSEPFKIIEKFKPTFVDSNLCAYPIIKSDICPKGIDGVTPNITIGNVDTLPSGSIATVTITGTIENPILNFGIPKGDTCVLTETDKQEIASLVINDKQISDKTTYSSKRIEEILKSPQYSNLIVTTTKSPLGTFSADYNSQEIRNWVNAGGTVEMRFDDVIENSGEQVYRYLKFKDNYAWFRRPVKEGNKLRQIDIKVDYRGTVTFTIDESIFATEEELKVVETTSNNALTLAQEVDQDKLGRKTYAVATDKLTQLEVADIISDYANYEGNIIEFLTNGDMPNKVVGYGFLMTDKNGNQFLNVLNLDGTITQWNKTTFEKHNVESYNYINELVDIDNLTIDIEGNPPFYATVQKAFNKPPNTSDFGMVEIKAYNKGMQIQKYTDMQNGKEFIRTVNGQPDKHSFGVWVQSNTIA